MAFGIRKSAESRTAGHLGAGRRAKIGGGGKHQAPLPFSVAVRA